jgi:hypothetical protein
MKKLICALFLVLPIGALADHIDVIEGQLKEDCSPAKYMAIVNDFNEKWAIDHDYKAEVFWPTHSNNLISIYWVGRSSSTAAWGTAFDQWNKDLMDEKSVASKLWARFRECSDNLARRSYLTY